MWFEANHHCVLKKGTGELELHHGYWTCDVRDNTGSPDGKLSYIVLEAEKFQNTAAEIVFCNYLIGKKIVGHNFSHSPIITIENKGFEIFSRPKF